jgi:F-type H+-transporting ATPase subunit epsilon
MAKLFNLTILTPERIFFSGEVEMLKLRTVDGDYAIMAGHAPIVMPVVVGSLTIWKTDGVEMAFNSEGFMEVAHEGTTVYIQACEHPEEIDSLRAEDAMERAEERLRQRQSMNEYKQSKMALARAMARLQVSKRRNMR